MQVKDFLSEESAASSSASPAADNLPTPTDDCELLRVMIIGSHRGVSSTIHTLHVLGFAQVSDWSALLPAPRSSEVMSILTRRIRRDRNS